MAERNIEAVIKAVPEMAKTVDFGKTAGDYGKHRAGFPPQFFDNLAARGLLANGRSALDIGTGTGTIARGLALRGLRVTGLDRSTAMMETAAQLDRAAGVIVEYIEGTAEETGMPGASCDLITAGQCWHWFDRPRAAAEAVRVLAPGGAIVIGHFDWIPLPGNMIEATEKLIEKFNPNWTFGGGIGVHPWWLKDLAVAGFRNLETFSFDLDVPYSHEAWRGRIRASAGVGATMPPDKVAAFDSELAAILVERWPTEPMPVLHRVWAALGTKR
jgi:ubiquinone/menaquinone biosynthesis C-methylase UbiE